jgi:hypothetical protein
VVVRAFLLTMGRIVGRVEVQKDLLRSIVGASLPHVELEEFLGHSVAATSVGRVLQA